MKVPKTQYVVMRTRALCVPTILGSLRFIVLSLTCVANATAMTIELDTMKGEPAILARGEIVPGDAKRLKAVLTSKAMHSSGYYALVLDSPGGSISEAFELSRIMDAHRVYTYVPPGGKCVGACASIVFIAGREHVAVKGSRLGFQGCPSARTKEIDVLCNEKIAEHAVAHGTSYGAVMAVIDGVQQDQILWVDGQAADCWGISRYDISPEPANYMKCVVDMIKGTAKLQPAPAYADSAY